MQPATKLLLAILNWNSLSDSVHSIILGNQANNYGGPEASTKREYNIFCTVVKKRYDGL